MVCGLMIVSRSFQRGVSEVAGRTSVSEASSSWTWPASPGHMGVRDLDASENGYLSDMSSPEC
jgi:hypothetical protein